MTYQKLSAYSACAWFSTIDPVAREHVERFVAADDHTAVDEQRQAKRRQMSLLARGLLRSLAGQLLGRSKDQIVIRKTDSGRPLLEHPRYESPVNISISHSHDIIAVAMDVRAPIGIDVEHINNNRDWPAIAKRIFPESVVRRIDSPDHFYRAWCLYEAWGKANDLNHINPERNADLHQLLECCLNENDHSSVIMFSPAEGYQGCLFRGDHH